MSPFSMHYAETRLKKKIDKYGVPRIAAVHFISKLEAAGFTVTFEDKRTFNIEYTLRDKRFSVMGLPYFLGLICSYFYKEDEVIDLINRCITAIDEANLRPNTKCELRFDQYPCL